MSSCSHFDASRFFGQEQTLCLWHRLEQRKYIFAKEKRKHNHKQIPQKNKTTGKNQQQKQKGTRKHKKKACFPIFDYCFLVFIVVFYFRFQILFCSVCPGVAVEKPYSPCCWAHNSAPKWHLNPPAVCLHLVLCIFSSVAALVFAALLRSQLGPF